jgi:hypothetical protein
MAPALARAGQVSDGSGEALSRLVGGYERLSALGQVHARARETAVWLLGLISSRDSLERAFVRC